MFIIYCMMYGVAGKQGYQTNLQESMEDTGKAFAGDFLSFGGIVFSSAAGSVASSLRLSIRETDLEQLGAGRCRL